MEDLTKTGGVICSRATRTCNKVRTSLHTMSTADRTMNLNKLINIRQELQVVGTKIRGHSDYDLMREEEYLEEEESYDDEVGVCMALLEESNAAPSFSHSVDPIPGAVQPQTLRLPTRVNLPQITLPTFGNLKEENLTKFLLSFESIIQKHNLSPYEKFIYLKNQLSGGPLALINSLEATRQQYDEAKTLLQEAFDSKWNSKNDTIKRLADLKLDVGDEPYTFIGEMRAICSNFETLEIETKDVLQYFIWESFNPKFKSHLTAITNNSRPSFEEISANIFEACNRYVSEPVETKKFNSGKFAKFNENTTVSAANIRSNNSKFVNCALCSHDKQKNDHPIRICPVYNTAKMKFEKLRYRWLCKMFVCKSQVLRVQVYIFY